jgi:hypothetical protein
MMLTENPCGLPTEIWHHVFSFIPSESLPSVVLISKKMRDILLMYLPFQRLSAFSGALVSNRYDFAAVRIHAPLKGCVTVGTANGIRVHNGTDLKTLQGVSWKGEWEPGPCTSAQKDLLFSEGGWLVGCSGQPDHAHRVRLWKEKGTYSVNLADSPVRSRCSALAFARVKDDNLLAIQKSGRSTLWKLGKESAELDKELAQEVANRDLLAYHMGRYVLFEESDYTREKFRCLFDLETSRYLASRQKLELFPDQSPQEMHFDPIRPGILIEGLRADREFILRAGKIGNNALVRLWERKIPYGMCASVCRMEGGVILLNHDKTLMAINADTGETLSQGIASFGNTRLFQHFALDFSPSEGVFRLIALTSNLWRTFQVDLERGEALTDVRMRGEGVCALTASEHGYRLHEFAIIKTT